MDNSGIIKIGPVGNKNGNSWDDKGRTKIVQIFISHDEHIKSIQFQYVENETLVLAKRLGENYGYKFDNVIFDYPSEYITQISGRKSNSSIYINSITFGTNRGEYGPFGQSTGEDKEFCFRLGDGHQFHGFYGTADKSGLKSIGVYLKPITTLASKCKNIVL